MKKLFIFLFCFMTGSVFADTTIVQKVESSGAMGQPGRTGNMMIYMKGSKMKIENMGPSISEIIDIDAKKIFIINSTQKTVMTASVDQMKQLMGGMGGQQANTSAQKTGNSKTVNGYPCEEYKITMSGMFSGETVTCVSDKIASEELDRFRKFSEDIAKQFGIPKDVRGYPVLSDTKMSVVGQNVTSHTEIVSVAYDPIPDSIFQIPPDYKTTEMPQMPKMG